MPAENWKAIEAAAQFQGDGPNRELVCSDDEASDLVEKVGSLLFHLTVFDFENPAGTVE